MEVCVQMSMSLRTSYFNHLQHLVAVMVDNLNGELTCSRLVERPAYRAVQTAPSGLVDLRRSVRLSLLYGSSPPVK